MVKRLRLFVKGNVDVHDSLHSCRLGGELLWNGINAAFRERSLDVTARVRHETFTRSDALLAATGAVPEPLALRGLALGVYPLASQFSRAIFEEPCDAIVLSIQPDVMTGLLRHRRDGFLFYPSGLEHWAPDDVGWIRAEFDRIGPIDVSRSMANLRAIIADRRVPVLIYNLSAVIPGETLHCYDGLDETLSERIKRFNLGLTELSRETGISIIDVDRVVAEQGASALKRDPVHLTEAGYRLLAHEMVRVLEDLGVLEG